MNAISGRRARIGAKNLAHAAPLDAETGSISEAFRKRETDFASRKTNNSASGQKKISAAAGKASLGKVQLPKCDLKTEPKLNQPIAKHANFPKKIELPAAFGAE
jgi:hypothetical protein